MLTAKENFLETLKPDGKPDRLVNDYEALAAVRSDPVFRYIRGNRIKGKTTQDPWGVTITWPEEQLFAFPTEWNKVCTDVTRWREQVHVPDIAGRCSDPALWKDAREEADRLRAQGKLIMGYMGTGMFEQSHDLMGLSDVCMALLEEPEAMHELLEAICEYRMTYASLLIEHLHPDAIISHDDWGSKTSLFMSPDTWREFFKPLYARFYGFIKSKGVMVIHHGDSYLEPIAEDMVELGIDVWQGTLNTNNIPALQKQLQGRMVLMGGIDSWIDREESTEEEIRADVRSACEKYGPGGHFIPCITYGLPGTLFPHVGPLITDEIRRYNLDTYGVG